MSFPTQPQTDISEALMPWTPLEHIKIADQWVATSSRAELVEAARKDCEFARLHGRVGPRLVFDCNGQAISLAKTDPEFKGALDKAHLIHADGEFVVKASKFFAARAIAERSATTDMIHDIAAMAVRNDLSFYLLGGTEEVNALCAERLNNMYPQLRIVGRRNGYFRGVESEVLADIANARPDILWVGLGKPYEQRFCIDFADRLDAVWVITCGGCFNFITGHYSRAPKLMQKLGLEWLHRAAKEPKRLAWRYITTSPHAVFEVITNFSNDRKVMTY